MALVLKDRVKESSTTSGTGTITLGGAFVGYQTFNTAVASGSTVYYTIHNTTAGNDQEWEVGVGTFTAPDQLTRDTVFSSSTGGSKVSFSGSSVLEVFITQPAEQAVYINDATGKVEVFGNGTNVVTFTEINTTNLTANTVTLTAGTISTNAASATDIVNKQYVDGIVAAGVHYHDPVLVESPTALTATYNQPGGAGNGVGATLTNSGANAALVIDGVTLSNTARVLVYTQANAVQNGIYTVTNEGAPDSPGPGAQWVLTRATDADTYVIASSAGLSQGSTVYVQSGDTGAGEVYTCTTPGTITFGSTNITFAQIGSAQVYSAGTGLSLTNTTFSISNTAVTAAQYGNDGNVAQITVNAQGQLTNAANVAINASSITVGTLANARTTASDANGASTIVARDATGSFTANTITATTSNATTFNGTTGSFTNVSGNGAAISAINASNISSGTIANARTTGNTANSASTLVLRDSNGSFGANIVSASFSGDGSAISAINASNISSGTIANARTTAASANGASTIVQRDSGGNFSANTITANISGDISGGTNINASNITSGTIANARTTASSSNGASTIVLRDAGGAFAAGAITGTSFSGNGAAITAINASAITTGTLDNARTSASSANGASTIVARDANGSFAGNVVTATTGSFTSVSGNGVALTAINASNITSGTLDNARTTAASANGASTIVSRDANGSFSANVVTATTFSGGGGSISAINASNLSAGTVASARVSGSYTGITGVGTLTAGTWQGNSISTTYTDAKVSNVATGTGLTGGPVTSTGTISLANTAVTPGSYTYASITVDQQGRLTAASSGASPSAFPSGTVMLFGQTAAPTGWTKDTTNYNNSGLRVVTGTASTGGTVDFTTAFASQTPTGSVSTTIDNTTATNQSFTPTGTVSTSITGISGSVSISSVTGSAGSTTLSTPQIPSHAHKVGNDLNDDMFFNTFNNPFSDAVRNPYTQGSRPAGTANTGGGGSHTHPFSFSSGSGSFTFSSGTASSSFSGGAGTITQNAHNHTASSSFTGNAINLAVKYVDVIRATKD